MLLTLMSTLTHFSLYQLISSEDRVLIKVLCQEKGYVDILNTVCNHDCCADCGYVDILNTVCNHDCCADCSLDLTLTVPFWKIAFLVRC